MDDFEASIRSRMNNTVSAAVERLGEWGATGIDTFETDVQTIQFNTPLPGSQPINSAIVADDGIVTASTIRYGVFAPEAFDTHPEPGSAEVRRLKRVVARVEYPGSLRVGVDFGDATRRARPHVRIGNDGGLTVHEMGGGDTELSDLVSYIIAVGAEIKDEYEDEFVSPVPGLSNAPRPVSEFVGIIDDKWDVDSAAPLSLTETELQVESSLSDGRVVFDNDGNVVRFSATVQSNPLDPDEPTLSEWEQTVESAGFPGDAMTTVTPRTGKRELKWDASKSGDPLPSRDVAQMYRSLLLRVGG